MTSEYVQTRKQFNRAVGSFQAVQHKVSDMYLKSEALRAITHFATWTADNDASQLSLASMAALNCACSYAPLVVENALQVHGGIGFTWEYDLHLYLRRIRTLQSIWQPAQAEQDLMLYFASKA